MCPPALTAFFGAIGRQGQKCEMPSLRVKPAGHLQEVQWHSLCFHVDHQGICWPSSVAVVSIAEEQVEFQVGISHTKTSQQCIICVHSDIQHLHPLFSRLSSNLPIAQPTRFHAQVRKGGFSGGELSMWSKWETTKGWPENERGHFSRASFFITNVLVVEGLFSNFRSSKFKFSGRGFVF